jgi:hypothetical protein
VLQFGWLWTCRQILRPDWKGFPRTNPLAYWASLSVMKEKSFITLTPGRTLLKSGWGGAEATSRMVVTGFGGKTTSCSSPDRAEVKVKKTFFLFVAGAAGKYPNLT